MDRPIVAVVMAGGTGTRLYPASRGDRPKQFRSFGGDRSLLARTADRVEFADETVVLTRPALADRIHEHAPGAEVLTEPAPKDTGPALLYAAGRLRERFADPVLLCVPADHRIRGDFATPARRAAAVAGRTGRLVTMGVEPTRPATGYGYLEPGADHGEFLDLARFHEKPDAGTAADYCDRGWYWNAGIFAWTPDALLRAARDTPLDPLADAIEAGDLEAGFEAVEPASIDRAVMERAAHAAIVPAGFAWDDLGTWDAVGRLADGPLCDALELDAGGNVLAGDHHVTAIGVEDLVVAAYDDRVLVVPAERAQEVREAVERLDERGLF
ncbi:MAG: mannose-1-phosphate guanylyltransferase [Halobacteriales archaeon]